MAMRILDIKLVNDGTEQSVAVEFSTGEVRTLTAQQLYEASRAMGQGASDAGKTAAQRRADEILAMRRGRR
jgi:hypothetical protein